MKLGVVVLAATLVSAPLDASAQDGKAPNALIDALAICLDIGDDAKRLACTDKAARALIDATRKREVVVVDKAEVARTRRSLFGFTLPRIGLFDGRGDAEEKDEIDELDAKITRVAELGGGKFAITIDSGARWNTTEPWTRGELPAPGLMLKIKKAALGSYFVKIGNARAVRAMRVG